MQGRLGHRQAVVPQCVSPFRSSSSPPGVGEPGSSRSLLLGLTLSFSVAQWNISQGGSTRTCACPRSRPSRSARHCASPLVPLLPSPLPARARIVVVDASTHRWLSAIQTLASLHALDPQKIGLGNYGSTAAFYPRQIRCVALVSPSRSPDLVLSRSRCPQLPVEGLAGPVGRQELEDGRAGRPDPQPRLPPQVVRRQLARRQPERAADPAGRQEPRGEDRPRRLQDRQPGAP